MFFENTLSAERHFFDINAYLQMRTNQLNILRIGYRRMFDGSWYARISQWYDFENGINPTSFTIGRLFAAGHWHGKIELFNIVDYNIVLGMSAQRKLLQIGSWNYFFDTYAKIWRMQYYKALLGQFFVGGRTTYKSLNISAGYELRALLRDHYYQEVDTTPQQTRSLNNNERDTLFSSSPVSFFHVVSTNISVSWRKCIGTLFAKVSLPEMSLGIGCKVSCTF